MKTITIKNPWANLICKGIKDIENRTWKTKYRGKILIHSAQTIDKNFRCMNLMFTPEQWKSLSVKEQQTMVCGIFDSSAIIGEVEIVDCVTDSNSVWALPNNYHWILKNPVMYDKPILNVKGKLSLWDYTGALAGN